MRKQQILTNRHKKPQMGKHLRLHVKTSPANRNESMTNVTTVGSNNQLAFNGCFINVVNYNNQIWFTSAELAKALGYVTSRAVTKLFNQNADEFSSGMTEVSVLGTSGNLQKKVRIFSLRGAHLIAMFARTKIAKAFRKWVLDILDNQSQIAVSEISPNKISVSRTNLICLVHHMIWLKEFYFSNDLYNTFKALNSDFGVRMHDHIKDGYCVAWGFKKDLQVLVKGGFAHE